MQGNQDIWASRAYVVGEIVITLATLVLAAVLLLVNNAAPNDTDKTIATSLATAVTIFWFQRRSNEQANNAVTTIANGKLTALVSSLDQARNDSSNRDTALSNQLTALTSAVALKQEAIDKVVSAVQAVNNDPAR